MRKLGRTIGVVICVGCTAAGGPDSLEPAVTDLRITPDRVVLSAGTVRALRVTALGPSGQLLHAPFIWTSTDELVAEVTPDGSVRAVGEGTAVVTVRAGSRLAAATVRVVPALDVSIGVEGVEAASSAGTEMCSYALTAIAVGGAPSDSAVWQEGVIEFVSPDGIVTVPVPQESMVDRFGTLVVRPGDSLTSIRLAVERGARAVHRIRFAVGGDLLGETVVVDCATAPGT